MRLSGDVVIHREIIVNKPVTIEGPAVVRLAGDFEGRAAFVVQASDVEFRHLTIDGNRAKLEQRRGLPPSDVPFVRFTGANGILAENVARLRVEDVQFQEIAGFALIAAASKNVFVNRVLVRDSGSRNSSGINNTTGGVLIEEGSSHFTVRNSTFKNVRGNAIWTHSLYTSARNSNGLIYSNVFSDIGRDAIQVGHATRVHVEANRGSRIGYPLSIVDVAGTPVGVDTAGNVDLSRYVRNEFSFINGKCIDLDGFHHGEVRGNRCRDVDGYAIVMNNTNPDMRSEHVKIVENDVIGAKFGAIFVIGAHNVIEGNRLLDLNRAGCNDNPQINCVYFQQDPDLLRSGIYLGRGAERPAPAHDNIIRFNRLNGKKLACITASPGAGRNFIESNRCVIQ